MTTTARPGGSASRRGRRSRPLVSRQPKVEEGQVEALPRRRPRAPPRRVADRRRPCSRCPRGTPRAWRGCSSRRRRPARAARPGSRRARQPDPRREATGTATRIPRGRLLSSCAMRNPRDFAKPLCIGAPQPPREVPFRPSRMIHFFDPSNPKMAAEGAGHREEGGRPARQPRGRDRRRQQGRGARGPRRDRERDRLRRRPALDAREQPRQPVGARRPDELVARDRRQARRHHGPEGRGAVGHPLRRPPRRAARGEARAAAAAPPPRDPRDRDRRRERRGDLRREPAHAGPLASDPRTSRRRGA